jgi:2-succinyl-5-enolpyruvyl-6-hydroxy-3-cyclohexene-1-carboxylate synthase
MPARNRNELWARTLLDELARAGVREVVVAPGSRSTPLVLTAAADQRFRITVQLDERSAAFLALGVGKATGVPGAVITTSGTAVANLFPAVVEAAWSETPLLLLTADRPPRLRGADANQAIDQLHLFGRYTRFFQELSPAQVSEATLRHLRSVAVRAVAAAVGDPGGPVHLNLPFDKPLEPIPVPGDLPEGLGRGSPLLVDGRPGGLPFTRIAPRRALPEPSGVEVLAERLRRAARPLLVAGPVPRPWEVGPALQRLAALGFPLLADPLSGARFGVPGGGGFPGVRGEEGASPDPACGTPAPAFVLSGLQDLALRSPEVRRRLRPDLVIRFGASPTSAAMLTLLEESAGQAQVVVDSGDRWKDHQALASHALPWDPGRTAGALADLLGTRGRDPADPRGEGEAPSGADAGGRLAWIREWEEVEAAAGEVLAGPGGHPAGFFEGTVLREVAARIPGTAILFVSSSMPVRDLDAFGEPRTSGPLVLGNRGASGIDGIVSTALGASLGARCPVVAVLGDLALIHDMNGLLAARAPGVRVLFVVIQNDGGGIFHHLPVREYDPPFTRLVATPHGREVDRIARLHDLTHLRVEGRSGEAGEDGRDGPDAAPDSRGRGVEGLRAALDAGLARVVGGEESVLLEVRTDRDENERRQREVAERVRSALIAARTEEDP